MLGAAREQARHYRITGFLGEGGFGQVYRAELLGSRGFRKEVAIKLLREGRLPDDVIPRFRDEARILGMVRDRAIVQVDPPIQFGRRWGLVMEYVEGVPGSRLCAVRAFPPRVVAEIGEEMARVLDKLYNMPGDDQQPLHLVHRDVKPANLHFTPDGDVKLLDFGIARARFDTREARTTNEMPGTPGYMPPERLQGLDGPAGDVFALGVTLRVLLTTERPGEKRARVEVKRTDEVRAVLALCDAMTTFDWTKRPDWPAVRKWAGELSRSLSGAGLREWTARVVPDLLTCDTGDEMVGNVLTEATLATSPPRPARRRGASVWFYAAVGAALFGIVGTGVVTLAAAIALWHPWSSPVEAPSSILPARPAPPVGEPPAVAPAPAEPPPAPSAEPTGPRAAPQPRPPAPPRPDEPKPAPRQVSTQAITFTSTPLGAEVLLDGRPIGETPLANFPIAEGKHTVELRLDADHIDRTLRVGSGLPTRYRWAGGEEWASY